MSKAPKKIKLLGATQVGFLGIWDDLQYSDLPDDGEWAWALPVPRREATIALLSWAGMVDAQGERVRGGRFDYLVIPPGTDADLLLAAASLVGEAADSESELADRAKGRGDATMAQKAADALSDLSLKLREEAKKAPPRAAQAPEDLGLDFPDYPIRPAVAPEDKPTKGDEKSRRKSLEIHLSEWFTTKKETVSGKEVSIPSLYNPNHLANTIIRKLEGEDNPIFYDPKAKEGSILRRGLWYITKAYDLTPAQAKWLLAVRIGGQPVNPSSLQSYFFPTDAAKHAKSPIGNKQDFAQAVKNGMKRVGVWTVERAVREWGIDDLAAFERAQVEPDKPDYGWADEARYSEVGYDEGVPLLLRGPAIGAHFALDADPEPAWWDEDSGQEPPPPPVLDAELREMLREASVAFSNYEPVSVALFAAINRAYAGSIRIQTWKDFDRTLREMHDAQSWFDFFYNAAKIKQYVKDFKEFLQSIEDQENAFEDAASEGNDLVVEFVFNKIVKGVFGIHNKGKDTNGMTVVSVGTGSTEGMTSWDSHSISFTAGDIYFFESDIFRYGVSKTKHVMDVDYKFFVESILKIITNAREWAGVIYDTLKAFSDESAKNVCREGDHLYIFSDGTRVSTWKYKDSGAAREAALMLEGKIVQEMREVLKRPINPPCGPSFYRNPPASLSPPRAEPDPGVIVRPPPPAKRITKPAPAAKPAPVTKPAPTAKTASQELEELAEMFDGAERAEMIKTARAMREIEEIVRLAAEIRNLGLGAFANTMDDLAALMGD